MNFPTIQKDKEDFNQQFFEDGISQPLVKTDQNNLRVDSQENSQVAELGKKKFSNLFIIVGGWFLFSSSTLLLYQFVLKPPQFIFHFWNYLVFFIGGLILLFISLGKIKKKSDLLLYALIPLLGVVFGTLYFYLVPLEWRITDAFGYSQILSYLVVLFVFYRIKGYFEASDN
jgi:hypothetical protein